MEEELKDTIPFVLDREKTTSVDINYYIDQVIILNYVIVCSGDFALIFANYTFYFPEGQDSTKAKRLFFRLGGNYTGEVDNPS